MQESSAGKKSFKHLLTKFPIGSVIELSRHRQVVNQLVSSANALEAKMAGLNDEIQAAVKAKIASGEAQPGEQVKVSIQLKLDSLGKGTLPLAGFVDVFEEPTNAVACLRATAYLLMQADLGLSSEEFSMLEIIFSENHGYMPLVTGYAPEVFA
jgi:hypothetical protein